jgi:hypothetical protein
MTTYPRPFLDRHLGRRPRKAAPRYPYSARLLKELDIFDLLVMDGGAFFFTNQHIGAMTTRCFIEAFESGRLLAPWTGGRRRAPAADEVDWFAAYDPEKGPWAPGQKTEQHVWLHRLYFLLPLAQEHFRTGKRLWARRWFDFFMAWRRRFPAMGAPAPAPKPHSTAYIWHDMQVTWRLLVLLHSVFLLGSRRGGRALAAAEWGEVYRAIAVHARWVRAEVGHALAAKKAGDREVGNHFLQKGTALVCAGTLFPEMEGAGDWVAAGRKVIGLHLRRDVCRDGGSVEASPSYSHFIVGLHLLADLMLAANGRPAAPGLAQSIRRQYAFLAATMSPSGRTLQLGDSYSLDARRDLAIVHRLFPLSKVETRRSRCFPASRFAVLRSAHVSVFIDAMDVHCGHIHPAKPNVLVYRGDRPVVVDCGCVNYDLPEYRNHYGSWAAHNVVAPASFLEDRKLWRNIRLSLTACNLTPQGGTVRFECRHDAGKPRFLWRRDVTLADDRLEVLDRVECPRPESVSLLWHLAKGARPNIAISGPRGRLRAGETVHAAVNESNRVSRARTLVCRQTGRLVEFRTVLVIR